MMWSALLMVVEMKKVLLADKDEQFARHVAKLLTDRGHRVVWCQTGTEVLERYVEEHPELIIVEILLPKVLGTEVCRAIKQEAKLEVSIILMSQNLSELEDFAIKSAEYRADDYLVKPFDDELFITKVERHLGVASTRPPPSRSEHFVITKLSSSNPRNRKEKAQTAKRHAKKSLLDEISDVLDDTRGQPDAPMPMTESSLQVSQGVVYTRLDPRVPINIPVDVKHLDAFVSNPMMNISQGGIFIRTDKPLPMGTELKLEFQLPNIKKRLKVTGTVVWTQPRSTRTVPAGMGVKFKNLTTRNMQKIQACVSKISKIVKTS